MCRWFAYISSTEPCLLEDVLIAPEHSLSKQVHDHYLPYLETYEPGATHADTEKEIAMRNKLFNADGFGAAWYTHARSHFGECEGPRPVLYHTLQQPLTDPTFRSICANTSTNALFAHVRAGSGATAIVTSNNHPFTWGRYSFMHNGTVGLFPQIRVAMLNTMSPAATLQIKGTTDSEHLAMMFFTCLAKRVGVRGPPVFESSYDLQDVRAALEEGITLTIGLQKKYAEDNKVPFEASSLNIAVTDGEQLLAFRFRNAEKEHPPSLYYSTTAGVTLNRKYPGHPSSEAKAALHTQNRSAKLLSADSHGRHVIVASEPTTYVKQEWKLIPKNRCLMVGKDTTVQEVDIGIAF